MVMVVVVFVQRVRVLPLRFRYLTCTWIWFFGVPPVTVVVGGSLFPSPWFVRPLSPHFFNSGRGPTPSADPAPRTPVCSRLLLLGRCRGGGLLLLLLLLLLLCLGYRLLTVGAPVLGRSVRILRPIAGETVARFVSSMTTPTCSIDALTSRKWPMVVSTTTTTAARMA
jgi:hypothetical protein